jgi:DNA-binding MarR family transcriptional regulator
VARPGSDRMLADKHMVDTSIDTDEVARLRAVVGRLARRLRPTEAAAGLTATQISVLQTVVRSGSVGLAELAGLEGLNPTMLSRVVAVLVGRGLVHRVADEGDRRVARVEATPAARRLRERMRKERNAKLEPLLEQLPPVERESLVAALPALESLADLLQKLPSA